MLALAMQAARGAAADTWPQFRGPDGQGNAEGVELPVTWGEDKNIIWKAPLVGRGWSSPIVADGRVWVTTAEEREPTPEERAVLMERVANQPIVSALGAVASVRLSAVELDAETGRVLRQIELFNIKAPPPIHGLNSYASPTPVIADGRLVCHFGNMGTACLDADSGKVLWKKTLVIDHIVGPGSSPVVYKNLVILTCDGGDKQFIAALDVETGEPVWQVDRPPIRIENADMRKAYCTPLVISAAGRDQMLIPGCQWFISYEPETGKEIWRIDHGSGFSNTPRPVFDGERAYLNTGFGKEGLWAVRVDGSGDVSETHVVWKHKQQIPTMSSPVVAGGRVYTVSDGGVASCLNAETGDVVWRERVPGQYSASALVGGDRVYFCSQEGKTTVVAASDKFEVLAENQLEGKLMASPAVVDGDLLLRTDTHLYRIGVE